MAWEVKLSPEALKFQQEHSKIAQKKILEMPPATLEEAAAQYERLNSKRLTSRDK